MAQKEATWQCEECGNEYSGEPSVKESYPGAELWFCEDCTK